MLKNKIISLLSVATMMFSFATVANAEKTPIIKDPTFKVVFNKKASDTEYRYYFGISYEGNNPTTMSSQITNQDEVDEGEDAIYAYKGVGVQIFEIVLKEKSGVTDCITSASGTWTAQTLTMQAVATDASASSKIKLTNRDSDDDKTVSTYFTVKTNKEIDVNDFECEKITIKFADYGNTYATSPQPTQTWIYSSDPVMVNGGEADFFAYTGAKSDDDDDTKTATAGNAYKERSTFYGDTVEIPTGAIQIDATIEKTNATAKTDKIDCPSGVVGGKAKILPIVSYKLGENGVTAVDIFTLILKNGTTELGKWTYTVPAE